MPDSLLDHAVTLIDSRRTLTLATAGETAWAAPVYYYHSDFRFYFFSKADSVHVSDALQQGHCAASIYRDSDDWRDIEGLQMRGHLHAVPLGAEAIRSFRGYVRKFPTVKSLFLEDSLDLDQFTRQFRTRLYCFVPQAVYYLNNRQGLKGRQPLTDWEQLAAKP